LKKRRFYIELSVLIGLSLFQWACPTPANNHPMTNTAYTNHLIKETSPYLLQHAHNPVNWYPWTKVALEKANKENKLLVISIGYAACHWCHVMEHESFEDTSIAHVMNDHYISIKVDREERPDVDHVYMEACQTITGSGGWPLNIIALPDGRPVYAGTYFNKEKWKQLLVYFSEMYVKDKASLVKQAEAVASHTNQMQFKPDHATTDSSIQILDSMLTNWLPRMDMKNGGNIGAPKFPMPSNHQFLLELYFHQKNQKVFEFTKLSLDKMCNSGIYDQLGGGFSRYSVDDKWLVPHFEKMLYDNAQMVSLYSNAYRMTGNERYAKVVTQILDWMQHDMTSPEGSFYSSLDADSDGEEGKYYVWKYDEVENLLGNDATLILEFYNLSPPGNWENGDNILHREQSVKKFATSNGLLTAELSKMIENANDILLKERNKRVKPATDDKTITAWNAMMITAYLDAFKVFHKKEYLEKAQKNAEFLMVKCMTSDYRLNRNYKNGRSNINAYLDDYAFVIEAFLSLYDATFESRWITMANNVNDYTTHHFYNKKLHIFNYTSSLDKPLISNNIEVEDNVIPSSNAVMANNLFRLGTITDNHTYLEMSKMMTAGVKQKMMQFPAYYSNWGRSLINQAYPPFEVVIVGDSAINYKSQLDAYYLPNIIVSGSKKNNSSIASIKNKYVNGKTLIYVCQGKTCQLPVESIIEVLPLIGFQPDEFSHFSN
jgi:uncharacterized protein YyaL (SSP411 family)